MQNFNKTGNLILPSRHNNKRILWDAIWPDESEPLPILIFIHGFKGFKDWGHFPLMKEYFAGRKFATLSLNLSHNGTTPEVPAEFADLEAFAENNFSIELDDVEVLLDHIFSADFQIPSELLDKNKVFLVGHSRGGSLAILKAKEDSRIKGLVTLAAVSDFEGRYDEATIGLWRSTGVIFIENKRTNQKLPLNFQLYLDCVGNERVSVPSAAKNIQVPWLIIHGKKDESVPFQMGLDLHSWNKNSTLYLMETAGHGFGGTHPYPESTLPSEAQEACMKAADFLLGINNNH